MTALNVSRLGGIDPGPSYGLKFNYTADDVLLASQHGATITNSGAVVAVTITLFPAIAGRQVQFSNETVYDFYALPTGTDFIGMGNPGTPVAIPPGTTVVFACLSDGKFSVFGTLADRVVSITETGAINGSPDDQTAEVQNAFNAAFPNSIPDGTFIVSNPTLPDYKMLFGFGNTSKLVKGADGPVMTLGDEGLLQDFCIDGDEGNFTGVGVTIPATIEFEGGQQIVGLTVINTESYCIEYSAEYAGYGSFIALCKLKPADIATYAVKWGVETASNHHGDRFIIGCNASYSPLVNAVGSNAGIVLGNIAGGLGAPAMLFDSASEKLSVVCNRFGSTGASQTIDGSQHTWVANIQPGPLILAAGSDVCSVVANRCGDITLTAGGDGHAVIGNTCGGITIASDGNAVVGNRSSGTITLSSGAENNVVQDNYGTVVDNSGAVGAQANLVDIKPVAYTPTWTASGTAPALGDGTLTGQYSRYGRTVTATIVLTMGATSTFGTGTYFFSLPFLPSTAFAYEGSARLFDSGTAHFVAITQTLKTGAARFELYANNTAGPVGELVPFTWAVGDAITASITYNI